MKRRWEKSAFALLSMFFFVFGGFFHPLFHAIPHAICGLGAEPLWHQAPSPDWDVHFHPVDCPVCVGALELMIPAGFDCAWPVTVSLERSPEASGETPVGYIAAGQPRAPPGLYFAGTRSDVA